jgi:tRNA nucleotidyltransferase (CCA-adding enzyme)
MVEYGKGNSNQETGSREDEPAVRFPLPETYVRRLEEQGLHEHAHAYRTVVELAKAFKKASGLTLLVGGSVRDVVFGKLAKDFDLEIYHLSPQQVEEITRRFGKVSDVGQAFGILKLTVANGVDIDISLPRTDSKISEGHRGFEVKVDPNMTVAEAALRRDFTMNTLAADPLTGEIHDHWGGIKDIQERRLRISSPERFQDDPLRVLRGLQFIARFGLELDPDSAELMRQMAPTLKELPKERILDEWKKLLVKSEKPSLGLQAGMVLGVFRELHPELLSINKPGQASESEVDPWVRTLSEVDAAAALAKRQVLDERQAFVLTVSTLCHNLVGAKLDVSAARSFLQRLGTDNLTRDKVLSLIVDSELPLAMYVNEMVRSQAVSDGEIRRLAKRIHPATIVELVELSEAVHTGRSTVEGPRSPDDLLTPVDGFPARDWLLSRARALGVETSKPADHTQGRDWLTFGFKPGPHIGRLVALSNDLRDDLNWSRERVFQFMDGMTEPGQAITKLEEVLRLGK